MRLMRATRTVPAGTVATPVVSSISPSTGLVTGATDVTITGTDFAVGCTVTIGGVAATSVVRVNSTTITATTPAGSAGQADVVVTQGSVHGTLTNGFLYTVANVYDTTGYTLADQRDWNSKAANSSDTVGSEGWDPGGAGGGTAAEWAATNFLDPADSANDDATAPNNPPHVGRIQYPVSFPSGGAPATLQTRWSAGLKLPHLISSFTMRYDGTFPSVFPGNKMKICFWTEDGSSAFDMYFGMKFISGVLTLIFDPQGTADASRDFGLGAGGGIPANVNLGSYPTINAAFLSNWHKYEFLFDLNTAFGVGDGVLGIAIDGTEYWRVTDLNYLKTISSTRKFLQMKRSPTWGGGTGLPNPALFYQIWDRSYNYVKA